MQRIVEILLGILLILLVVGQPRQLQQASRTTLGKIGFLVASVVGGSYNLVTGVLVVAIYMTLSRHYSLVEGMENEDFVKKYCKDGNVDESLKPPTLKFNDGKCNPCDESCEFEITTAKEQITIDEALRPKESNTIPVNKNN
jgi:hypothetical protein